VTALTHIEARLRHWISSSKHRPGIVEAQEVLFALNGVSPVLGAHDPLLLDDMACSKFLDTDLWNRICAIAWLQLLTPGDLATGLGLFDAICPWLDEFTEDFHTVLNVSALSTEGWNEVLRVISDYHFAVLSGMAATVAAHCTGTSLADTAKLVVLNSQVELRATARVYETWATDEDLTLIHAAVANGQYWALLGFCIALRHAIHDDTRRLPVAQAA
jgi:hypothetical protein